MRIVIYLLRTKQLWTLLGKRTKHWKLHFSKYHLLCSQESQSCSFEMTKWWLNWLVNCPFKVITWPCSFPL